jgi:hypothetical protein
MRGVLPWPAGIRSRLQHAPFIRARDHCGLLWLRDLPRAADTVIDRDFARPATNVVVIGRAKLRKMSGFVR